MASGGHVLFDSGANCCITNVRDNFLDFEPLQGTQQIDEIGKGLKIAGRGHVLWAFEADDGMYRALKLPCYFVPSSNTRIASIQEILKAYPKESVTMSKDHMRLPGYDDTPSLTIPYCPTTWDYHCIQVENSDHHCHQLYGGRIH